MRILAVDGQYFTPCLRAWGHQVLKVGTEPGCDVVLDRSMDPSGLLACLEGKGFWPELVIWSDNSRPPALHGLERLPAVTVGFSVDQYCNPWHVPYSAAFDLFLVSQRGSLDLFRRLPLPRPCGWLPLFCRPARDRDPGLDRDIPVGFVGTLDPPLNPSRRTFLERFGEEQPLALHQGEYAPIFGRSRIVLNQSAAGELNFRVFQAAACGAAVLTEDTENGLRELFRAGEEILTYPRGDAVAAARRAREVLASGAWEAVGRAGRERVEAEHTVEVRARALLEQAEALMAGRAQQWRLAHQRDVWDELARAFYLLAGDVNAPLPEEVRQGYREAARRYEAAE